MPSSTRDYNMPTDRKVAKKMLQMVKENVKELPSIFADVIDAQFGGNTDAYVDYLYDNSLFTDEQKALSATAEQVAADPGRDPGQLARGEDDGAERQGG